MTSAEDIPAAPPAPVAPPASLLGVLRALARRDLALAWTAGACRILAFFLGFGVLRCLFDFWVQLDWVVRAVFLAIDLAIIVWIGRRRLWRPWKRRLSVEGAALRLERVFPVLGSRVIAAVQLPRQLAHGNLSSELVGVVVRDADGTLAALPWRKAAPGRSAWRWLGLFAAIAVVAGGLFALRPETAAVLARRWLLSSEPAVTRTHLALAQTDLRIALGSPVTLGATATGAVPKQAIFEMTPASGEPRTFPVGADAAHPGVFSLRMDNVRQSFRYRVLAGDARSPWHEVETLPAPSLLDLRFVVSPPAYTGLPENHIGPDEELVVPAGSVVRVEGRSSLPLKSARIVAWPAPQETAGPASAPLKLAPDRLAFSGGLTLAAPVAALTLPLDAANGVPSQDDTRHPVRFVPDVAPTVDITAGPPDGESDTADALIGIKGRATDDYGISALALCWEITVAKGKPQPGRRELPVPAPSARRADFSALLTPGAAPAGTPAAAGLSTGPGASVVWWLEATDNAPVPHHFATPRRTLHVVTADEKLTLMMARLREGMGELDDVGRHLERVNESLGRLLPDGPPSQPKSAP